MGAVDREFMSHLSTLLTRLLLLGCLTLILAFDTSDAYAQSRNCRQLENTLSSIERSGDFRNLDGINDRLRRLQQDVQRAESAYVRDGCNAAAQRGERLTSACQAQARTVLRAREARDTATRQAETGNAVAQQREAVLQEMARFNCAVGPSNRGRQPSRGLFDDFFGDVFGDGVAARGDEFAGYAGYATVRTVCVRKVDGYYWPISYSTLVDYAPNDLMQCQQQCPGADVDLYYYRNPGQEPEQMVNLYGEPYTSLPAAFAYRTDYDPANSCKSPVTYGGVSLVTQDDGTSRAVISYGQDTFPLPLRDPRRPANVTVVQAVANVVDVPLPRRRPPAPGEQPPPVAVQQTADTPLRIVQFGDKRVRIVGPDTPYAPTAAEGT